MGAAGNDGANVVEQGRVLVIDSASAPGHPVTVEPVRGECTRVATAAEALELLSKQSFAGVYANLSDEQALDRVKHLFYAEQILNALKDGVALIAPDQRIFCCNAAFAKRCQELPKGRSFYEALGSPEVLGPDYNPLHTALAGKSVTTRLHCHDNTYLQLQVTPVFDAHKKIDHLIALCHDVTAEVQQQQKLDAIHQAGRDLASLPTDQIAEMCVAERVELLKQKIRTYIHNLLHYDVIELRLLDRLTGKLEPLLQEGMTPEAATRVLYARAEGNGVTGFVAATGQSYLCHETATDPHYIEGATGTRSSLTVPILFEDQVIGTFNVESPRADGLNEDDQQFAEIFSREIAAALHTLDLLSAEKRTTASRSIEAISREVVMPVDEILGEAAAVLDRYLGHDPEMATKLRQILAAARSIKACIQKIGENLAPTDPAATCPAAPSRFKGMRVLVADSDERFRRSAHGILGRLGCVVETARDGQEAVTMTRLTAYDAILSDIRLPDVSGYEIYRKLRQLQPQARVILMTSYGYDPSHAIVKARQDGLQHVLFKPFRVDQLLAALEEKEEKPAPTGTFAMAPAAVQA